MREYRELRRSIMREKRWVGVESLPGSRARTSEIEGKTQEGWLLGAGRHTPFTVVQRYSHRQETRIMSGVIKKGLMLALASMSVLTPTNRLAPGLSGVLQAQQLVADCLATVGTDGKIHCHDAGSDCHT